MFMAYQSEEETHIFFFTSVKSKTKKRVAVEGKLERAVLYSENVKEKLML